MFAKREKEYEEDSKKEHVHRRETWSFRGARTYK